MQGSLPTHSHNPLQTYTWGGNQGPREKTFQRKSENQQQDNATHTWRRLRDLNLERHCWEANAHTPVSQLSLLPPSSPSPPTPDYRALVYSWVCLLQKLGARKSWNDVLDSSRGNRRKGMEREQAFLQFGQVGSVYCPWGTCAGGLLLLASYSIGHSLTLPS